MACDRAAHPQGETLPKLLPNCLNRRLARRGAPRSPSKAAAIAERQAELIEIAVV
jgi:hypothetical protein